MKKIVMKLFKYGMEIYEMEETLIIGENGKKNISLLCLLLFKTKNNGLLKKIFCKVDIYV